MNEFDIVIGLEIHCELKTKSKMFSSAPVDFSSLPNTNVSPIDMAFPGTLPRVNKRAVELALMTAKALNMEIDNTLIFDRKNYFYTDLAKGFQITQDKRPLGKYGYLEIKDKTNENTFKKIRINRLHLEEDTAKQLHFDDYTLIDYNRSGVPLIEIVSEPDIRSGSEARNYIENLRNILVYLDASDGKMEEGSLRCDVNISVKPKHSKVLGVRTEIKNLNSINNVEKAINYEANRHINLIKNGKKIEQETRRYDEATSSTVLMRKKGDAADYKYFTEPNIAPIVLEEKFIQETLKNMPVLPLERFKNYVNNYQIDNVDANIIIARKSFSDYLDACLNMLKDDKALAKIIVNFLIGDISSYLNDNNVDLNDINLNKEELIKLAKAQFNKEVSSSQAKEILKDLITTNKTFDNIVREKGFKQVHDEDLILNLVKKVLDDNAPSIEAYKNGKTNVLGYLIGQVMKESKGQANPALAAKLVKTEIEKR